MATPRLIAVGDQVITPSGRFAIVVRILPDGFLALRYLGVTGHLQLDERLVRRAEDGDAPPISPVRT